MPLRALFLDVGETLLTTIPSRFAIYAEAASARGVDVSPERMHALMHAAHHALPERVGGAYRYADPWFEAFIERIFAGELGFGAAELAAITDELFARFESPASYRLFPGVRELIGTARARGLVIGVVSNWSARLPRLLANLGLAESFDFVLASALVGCEKPDPAIFELALERAGVAPGEALHAGDHPRLDVAAARALGLEAALVDHGGRHAAPDAPLEAGATRVGGLPELAAVILDRLP